MYPGWKTDSDKNGWRRMSLASRTQHPARGRVLVCRKGSAVVVWFEGSWDSYGPPASETQQYVDHCRTFKLPAHKVSFGLLLRRLEREWGWG